MVDDAAGMICRTVGLKHVQTTPESRTTMDDHLLSAEAKTALMKIKVLLVDDEKELVEVLAERLEGRGCDHKSAQQKRARQEETKGVDNKPDRNRFPAAIYDFVYGSRPDHRSKS